MEIHLNSKQPFARNLLLKKNKGFVFLWFCGFVFDLVGENSQNAAPFDKILAFAASTYCKKAYQY